VSEYVNVCCLKPCE